MLGSWQCTLRATIIAGEVLVVALAVFAMAAHSFAANAGLAAVVLTTAVRWRGAGGRHRKTLR
ncbi:hypothetical protein VSH64_31655 [Amycolatopsis rhabdoformis]|uniref:Uncharacterized protein n=1 Tax=Amycolatopsis rhabdoformis TaxID=1448059 RepID=A0ABZ1I0S5_9PSEU|nr:hypothetical protein [Amycolatopsis rhabdoformis]WSE27401.1 hypothetical protein VSH64_31655 [Amycolatopsis rhabdoformis]